MPGALPLLSFALSELFLKYLKRQHDAQSEGKNIDRALTEADYKQLGSVMQSESNGIIPKIIIKLLNLVQMASY